MPEKFELGSLSPRKITIDPLVLKEFGHSAVSVDVLRLDKIHPEISGNKWFKLRYYLDEAQQQEKEILTFGGAWSNHILATAALCHLNNIGCTGIIRGERPSFLSTTLIKARQYGMRLEFIDRENYRNSVVPDKYDATKYLLVPAGGQGVAGVLGASTITDHFDAGNYTQIFCAVGTGTMMAGILMKSDPQSVTGISVMKNNHTLANEIQYLLNPMVLPAPTLMHDYHFGGYAKFTSQLIDFMNSCFLQSGIPTDFVYTGKLFFGITDMINKGIIQKGSRILPIHSGGLQGNLSLSKGTLIL